MFGERKIDNSKTNEELKNSNKKKSNKGQPKRVTTTIKNEETEDTDVNNFEGMTPARLTAPRGRLW